MVHCLTTTYKPKLDNTNIKIQLTTIKVTMEYINYPNISTINTIKQRFTINNTTTTPTVTGTIANAEYTWNDKSRFVYQTQFGHLNLTTNCKLFSISSSKIAIQFYNNKTHNIHLDIIVFVIIYQQRYDDQLQLPPNQFV